MSTSILDVERRKSPAGLSTELAETFYHGSRAKREQFHRLRALLEAHVSYDDGQKLLSEPIEEQRKRALRMSCLSEKLILKHKLNEEEADLLRNISYEFSGFESPILLHNAMFTKNIKSIFTPEQQASWGSSIESFKWLGCYAQTELGHGSNLRSLETTATFLPDQDKFELHSPTLTSYKYWPGALASTANMAVVYARLLVHGKDYGVHSFLLQLRDFETHRTLPAITVGHIGRKIAFNNVDNGYLKLDRVLIPRTNMAMKFSTLSRDGVYSSVQGVKREISYFTMLQMRYNMMFMSGKCLSKAALIAVRYSAVRLQGLSATEPNKELQILDYQTQQHRLLPRVAESYAIMTTSHKYTAFCADATAMVDNGTEVDPIVLTMAHASSCALKIVASELCTNGIEVCRRACGGHGYLQSSGLPELLGYAAQFVTAEGENYVISQQTSRTLVKLLQGYRKGMALSTPELQVLGAIDAPLPKWSASNIDYVAIFQRRFLALLKEFEATAKRYKSMDHAIQDNLIESHHLALSYGKYVLVHEFAAAVNALPASGVAKPHARNLFELFCVTQLQHDFGDFVSLAGLPSSTRSVLHKRLVDLLATLRPHAVALAEGFDHTDATLNSTLGRADGRVYEALMKSSLLYASDEIPAFTEYLQPLRQLHARL
ncbi:hypothetical protein AC1031_005994 [Aphanomyces cochlioides]|nr:hypothetical protein AC1031_005994 [Aphanomyces cochlioides]